MDLRSLSFNIGFKGSTAGIDKMNSATDKLKAKMTGVDSSTNKATSSVSKLNSNMSGATGTAGSLTSGLVKVAAAVMGVVGAGKLLNISDQMANSTARINLMNDGLQSTKDVQADIFQAALDTHSEYFSMADAVGKLGITTGAAFSGTDEILKFVTQVNKQFAIGGTSAEGQSAAMLQLTQAMASGVLRGDELNSIYENAPTLIKSMADYMGVPVEQMRSLAEEGKITTDVIKNGVLGATEETNKKFAAMGLTFTKVWTDFKTKALQAFQPAMEKLNELANSQGFQTLMDNTINSLATMGPALVGFVSGIVDLFNNPALQNFVNTAIGGISGIISTVQASMPVIVGIAAAMIAWSIATGVVGAAMTIFAGIQAVHAAAMAMTAGATLGEAAAQWGLNAAFLACPITWIVIAIIALVAAIAYLWNTNEGFRTAVIDIWNGIVGAFQTAVTGVQTAWGAVVGFFQGIWDGICTVFANVVGFYVGVYSGAWNGICSVWGAAVGWFQGIADGIGGAFSGISGFITGAFDGAIAFLTGLPGQFLQWGADMVQGLIDGIKSGITAVGDAVKGVADKISSFLHFSRPDVGPLHYYETWMPDMMQGLANGIYAGTPKVEQATSGVSTTMAGNLSGKATASGGISGNTITLSPTFQVNVGESTNAKGIVSDIEKEFYKFMERYSKELELRNQPVYV